MRISVKILIVLDEQFNSYKWFRCNTNWTFLLIAWQAVLASSFWDQQLIGCANLSQHHEKFLTRMPMKNYHCHRCDWKLIFALIIVRNPFIHTNKVTIVLVGPPRVWYRKDPLCWSLHLTLCLFGSCVSVFHKYRSSFVSTRIHAFPLVFAPLIVLEFRLPFYCCFKRIS